MIKQAPIQLTVTTAHELNSEQKKQVETIIANRVGDAKLIYEVNSEILGGLKLTIGNQTYDASLEGKLTKIALSNQVCTVTSAVALDASQKKALTQALQKNHGQVTIEEVVDPKVIGGVKIVIGSKEYDNTILGKLSRLKTTVLNSM